MRQKSIFLTKRLLRLVVLFLLIVLITLGVILAKPMLISSLISKELQNHGIYANVQKLSSTFSGTQYQIIGHFSAKASTLGVDIPKGNISATFDWYDLLAGKPFVKNINTSDGEIVIDRKKLLQHDGDDAESNSFDYYEDILPTVWSISQTKLSIDEQTLNIDANGKSDEQALLKATDSENGNLELNFSKSQQQLSVTSQQLNLQAFTGHPVVLRQLNARIDTKNLLASRAHTMIRYKGTNSFIDIEGHNDDLRVKLKNNGKTVTIHAKPINGSEGVKVLFDDVDISAFETISLLLPQEFEWPQLSGFVSGSVIASRANGIEKAELALTNVGVAHSFARINHVFGDISYEDDKVRYLTQLQNSEIAMASQFPNGIAPLSGKINGVFDATQKILGVQKINLHSADFENLSASGELDFESLNVNLAASAKNINIAKSNRLIPTAMPEEVRKWLGKALISGKKNQTELTMRGALKDFFHNKDSVFIVKSDIKNSVLHYLDGNPDINIQHGILDIDGTSINVDVRKANIRGIPLKGDTFIADFLNTEVVVNAKLVKQPVKKILPIAERSIAQSGVQVAKKILDVTGNASVTLALNLPLSANIKKEYSFDVRIAGDALSATLKDFPQLAIEKAKTTVLINEDGLRSVTVNGQYGKKPVNVAITRDEKENYIAKIDIVDNALVLLKKLKVISAKQYSALSKHNLLKGKSLYSAVQTFDKDGAPVGVEVTSSLVGSSLNLFNAVIKANKSKTPLTATYTERDKKLTLSLAKRFSLTSSLDKNNQLAGLFLSNKQGKTTYKKGTVYIAWYGKRFNFEKLNQLREALNKVSSNNTATPTLKYQFDIAIDSLQMAEKAAYPFKLHGKLSHLTVKSPLAQGNVYYKKNRFDADFKQLDIGQIINFFSKTEVTPEGREVAKIDLAKALPQMQIVIDKLIYKGNNVGNASVRTSIRDGRYSIDQIFVRGKDYFLETSGYEAKEPQGITTKIQADFKGEDINKIVNLFKLNPILDGKFIDISANLSWPGKAHDLNLRQSYGKATLNAQNVKLVNVSSGLGSVLGLMDITSIFKRISLDFQNLSSSKISFDTVHGDWNIGGGRAITNNAYATGSLINLKIRGATDLHRRQFDNIKATVIPKASNVIPVVGAVAGGVVGAVIGVVVQQVAGDAMDKAAGLPYVVSGSWTNPVVTPGKTPPKKTSKKQKSKSAGAVVLESLE